MHILMNNPLMAKTNEPKLVRPKVNKILSATVFFVLVNIILSALLTYDYYLQNGASTCSVDGFFGCGGVATTQYAVFLGIPHALLGIIFYTLLFIGIAGVVLCLPFHRILKPLRPQTILNMGRWASYVAALYAFYLSYAEIALLGTFAPLYLIQQLMIFIILGLQIWANIVIFEGKKETRVCEFC
ncbi:hypothetical protein GF369_03310 [Candidatus Peregrinibacteria bacterium]|nr:hypothetical protein [Candidatus Peregrinibacteria bacterium]